MSITRNGGNREADSMPLADEFEMPEDEPRPSLIVAAAV
jgi:hypothetical protein